MPLQVRVRACSFVCSCVFMCVCVYVGNSVCSCVCVYVCLCLSDDDDVFICSCRNKKEEPSSIYTLRKVRTIRGCLEGLTLII